MTDIKTNDQYPALKENQSAAKELAIHQEINCDPTTDNKSPTGISCIDHSVVSTVGFFAVRIFKFLCRFLHTICDFLGTNRSALSWYRCSGISSAT